jgi:hypothetical protein
MNDETATPADAPIALSAHSPATAGKCSHSLISPRYDGRKGAHRQPPTARAVRPVRSYLTLRQATCFLCLLNRLALELRKLNPDVRKLSRIRDQDSRTAASSC